MKKKSLGLICAGLLVLGQAGMAQAALVDRGGGMIYDNLLDVTWLQDANYAQTSGYDVDGKMNWNDATAWVAGLTYGGYSDWRLPTANPINGSSYSYGLSYAGTTDYGYNIGAPGTLYAGSTANELAHMFFTSLGNIAYRATNGSYPQPGYGLSNVDLFTNLQAAAYWTGSDYGTGAAATTAAWNFNNNSGYQNAVYKSSTEDYVWVVRSGDVALAPVPLPAAVWLFGTALAGLGLFGRNKRRG